MIDAVPIAVGTLVVSVAALWVGAEAFVSAAAGVARQFGLSDLVVGLTVVAMGTSAPEAAVSVDAALAGTGDVAVANVVGSNLFNIGIVLGGIAIAVGVRSTTRMVHRDGLAMVLSTILLLAVLWDRRVSRLEGLLLLGAFAGYLAFLFVQPDEPVGDASNVSEASDASEPSDDREATWRTPVVLLAGLGTIVIAAHVLVESAVVIASAAGLSEWVIGETVVAVGTSTPEIAASVAAARRGLGDVAAGNLVGSNVFNALFVLGLASALGPIAVVETAIATTGWLLGLTALTAALLATDRRLGRLEGATLVAINLTRWLLNLF